MKVGICGLGGRMGMVSSLMALADDRIELVAYADPSPAGIDFLTRENIPLPRSYAALPDMLAAEKLDLLLVGSPNHLHLEHIRAGLDAGLRVFSEKPVVTTEEDTYEILRLLRQHGEDSVMVGLVLRYSPLYRRLLKFRDAGAFGKIASIEASEHISPDHGAFFMRDWRRYEKFSGGFMLEKCCHDIDLYQNLVGSRPLRVASFGGRHFFTPEHAHLEAHAGYQGRKVGWSDGGSAFSGDADIIDSQTAIIEYANGAHMCFHTNLNTPDKFRRFCVIGTNGMAEGDFERNYLNVFDGPSREKHREDDIPPPAARGGHYGADAAMARDICAHLFDGAPLPVSVRHALEAGLTALKIDEARKTRTVIDMAEAWGRFDAV